MEINRLVRKSSSIRKVLAYIKGMGIIKKFVFIYFIIFVIPILFFALYSFNNANENLKEDYYNESREELDKAYANISQNIRICENVMETALGNTRFIDFTSKDMLKDDLALIEFKRSEYSQIVNLINFNPSINNIHFFIDNDKVYELPPLLFKENSFGKSDLISYIKSLKGNQYFEISGLDTYTGAASNRVVSLYREILGTGQKHLGILEVNMLQEVFFNDLYTNPAEEHSALFLLQKGENEIAYYDSNRNFYIKRREVLKDIISGIKKETLSGQGNFHLRIGKSNFVVIYRYLRKLDSFIYQIYSTEGITVQLDYVRNNIIIAVTISIIVLFFVTYFSAAILLKKLNRVVYSMRKVQAGNLDVSIPVKGNDEVDEAAIHFNHMVHRIKDLISELVAKKLAVKDAELKALQSQINSHFINNVLESIRMLAEIEKKREIADAIASLGQLMRYSMSWKRKNVYLEEEISLVNNYIVLMNIVADMKIELKISINSELLAYRIPKMSIQPLVENAVNHGLEPKGTEGQINISAFTEKGRVVIEITDDGVGIDEKELNRLRQVLLNGEDDEPESKQSHGIGLLNVQKRINLFCGDSYGIKIDSIKNEFTKVSLHLDCEKKIGGW